jgi:phosphate transport system substrate-binding protein
MSTTFSGESNVKKTSLRQLLVVGTAALALTASACSGGAGADGGDSGSGGGSGAELSGELAGGGASSQGSAQEAWIATYTEVAPDVNVTYDPIGSGGGREQFLSGGFAFAGSDSYLDEEEAAAAKQKCGGDFIQFPGYISPIAVGYNLPDVKELNLSPSVIAQIFDMKITKWNDPKIAELNEGVKLPATAINPIHRSDESGTTENFADYLHQAAPKDWPHEPEDVWPVEGGEPAAQTQGVAQALTASVGSIAYLDASQVGQNGVAKVQVGDEFVAYSPEAAAAAVDKGTEVEGQSQYSYAIDLVSYLLACTSYDDPATANLVKGYLGHVISAEGQDVAASEAGAAPISDTVREFAQGGLDAIKGA